MVKFYHFFYHDISKIRNLIFTNFFAVKFVLSTIDQSDYQLLNSANRESKSRETLSASNIDDATNENLSNASISNRSSLSSIRKLSLDNSNSKEKNNSKNTSRRLTPGSVQNQSFQDNNNDASRRPSSQFSRRSGLSAASRNSSIVSELVASNLEVHELLKTVRGRIELCNNLAGQAELLDLDGGRLSVVDFLNNCDNCSCERRSSSNLENLQPTTALQNANSICLEDQNNTSNFDNSRKSSVNYAMNPNFFDKSVGSISEKEPDTTNKPGLLKTSKSGPTLTIPNLSYNNISSTSRESRKLNSLCRNCLSIASLDLGPEWPYDLRLENYLKSYPRRNTIPLTSTFMGLMNFYFVDFFPFFSADLNEKVMDRKSSNNHNPEEIEINHLTNYQKELEKIGQFIYRIEKSYQNVPYHNHRHAVDVLAAVEVLMNQVEQSGRAKFTAFERFTTLLAAACHDVGHPAVNSNHIGNQNYACDKHLKRVSLLSQTQSNSNNELKNEKISPAASETISSGLLERYHCKLSLAYMKEFGLDIVKRNDFRQLFDNLIMATDMTHHNCVVQLLVDINKNFVQLSRACTKTSIASETFTDRTETTLKSQNSQNSSSQISINTLASSVTNITPNLTSLSNLSNHHNRFSKSTMGPSLGPRTSTIFERSKENSSENTTHTSIDMNQFELNQSGGNNEVHIEIQNPTLENTQQNGSNSFKTSTSYSMASSVSLYQCNLPESENTNISNNNNYKSTNSNPNPNNIFYANTSIGGTSTSETMFYTCNESSDMTEISQLNVQDPSFNRSRHPSTCLADADRLKLLEVILHLADLSNPAKEFDDSKRWANQVFLGW